MIRYTTTPLLLLAIVSITCTSSSSANTVLMDASSNCLFKQIPTSSTSNGIVSIVSSPGTPSPLSSSDDTTAILSLDEQQPYTCLSCRGATLSASSPSELTSLATTSLVSGAVIVDGITEGDIESGLSSSRHGRTLAALFRARLASKDSSKQKQTLFLAVVIGEDDSSSDVTDEVESEVKSIFDAAAVGNDDDVSLSDMYDVKVISVQSQDDAGQVMSMASEAAKSSAQDSTLSDLLAEAQAKVRETGVSSEVLDTPQVAAAFLMCREVYAKHAQKARSKLAAWKSRVARGLVVDQFGTQAENLYKRTMDGYDTATISTTGMSPSVASYRLEMRSQLQNLIESGLRSLYAKQVSNLEKSTMKKFESKLLQKVNMPSTYDENAASLRSASFAFDNAVSDLDIPTLGLTKDKGLLDMSSKLNDALENFPDSPAAQIKRMKQVSTVIQKDKKPTERSIDLGLDLVAMFRPDGFGSFQGFCGYQMGGNSITVGCHNDADDPQVISQFGGVRPPLLRVQPKLRVDVEL